MLTIYFALWCIVLRARHVPFVRFDFVVTATWLASVVLALLPIVHYEQELADRTVLLIVLCHAGLLVGFSALGGSRSRVGRYAGTVGSSSKPLAVIAMSFVVISFGAALSAHRIPVLGAFGSLQTTRNSYLAEGFSSRAEELANTLQYAGIVFVVLLPLYIRERRRTLALASSVTFLAIIETSFASGARASIVFALVGMAATYLMCFEFALRRYIAVLAVGAAAIFLLGGTFLMSRNEDLTNAPDFYLARLCAGATFAAPVQDNPQLEALAIAGCYFSSPVYVFNIFITDKTIDEEWVGRAGAYNLGRVFQSQFAETRAEIAAFYRVRAHAENPWATSVRDMWIDLRGLAPAGFIIVGAVIALLARPARSEMELARLALLAPVGFMIPFISPLIIPQLVYPIVVTIILHLAMSRDGVDSAEMIRGRPDDVRSASSSDRMSNPGTTQLHG